MKIPGKEWREEKLLDYLRYCGISQVKLAEMIGMKEVTLRRKILGQKEFKFSEVCAICEAVGITNPLYVFNSRKEK